MEDNVWSKMRKCTGAGESFAIQLFSTICESMHIVRSNYGIAAMNLAYIGLNTDFTPTDYFEWMVKNFKAYIVRSKE